MKAHLFFKSPYIPSAVATFLGGAPALHLFEKSLDIIVQAALHSRESHISCESDHQTCYCHH